jgi:DNA polymerase-3 subunit gamma/tau
VKKLTHIAKAEKIKISDEALQMIALSAEGGMRDAESLFMQIVSLGVSPISEDTVAEALGTTKRGNVTTLIRLIGENDLFGSLALVREISRSGADLSLFAGLILHFLRDLLLVSSNREEGLALLGELTDEQKSGLTELAILFTATDIVIMLEYFQMAQVNSKTAVVAELPLEIAIVKILSGKNHDVGSMNHQDTPGGGATERTETPAKQIAPLTKKKTSQKQQLRQK